MTVKYRVQVRATQALLFTCNTFATAQTMAAGCGIPTRIVTVRVSQAMGY